MVGPLPLPARDRGQGLFSRLLQGRLQATARGWQGSCQLAVEGQPLRGVLLQAPFAVQLAMGSCRYLLAELGRVVQPLENGEQLIRMGQQKFHFVIHHLGVGIELLQPGRLRGLAGLGVQFVDRQIRELGQGGSGLMQAIEVVADVAANVAEATDRRDREGGAQGRNSRRWRKSD